MTPPIQPEPLSVWAIISILTCVWLAVCLGFWWLFSSATKVHDGLRAIRAKAEEAKGNNEALKLIAAELLAYYKKYCYARPYGAHAAEVMAYINGAYTRKPVQPENVRQTLCHAACYAAATGAKLEDITPAYQSPAVIATCQLYTQHHGKN